MLNILSYADDTTVYQSGPNVDNLIKNTNHELKLLYDWLCENKLSLNVKKTNWCIFSPQNSNFEVNLNSTINNEIISQIGIRDNEETVKFLGIYRSTYNVEKTYKLGQLKNGQSYLRN